MKNLFRDYTYSWWHIAIFKLALLAIGMIAGAYLAEWVQEWVWLLGAIAIIGAGYIMWHSFRSHSPTARE